METTPTNIADATTAKSNELPGQCCLYDENNGSNTNTVITIISQQQITAKMTEKATEMSEATVLNSNNNNNNDSLSLFVPITEPNVETSTSIIGENQKSQIVPAFATAVDANPASASNHSNSRGKNRNENPRDGAKTRNDKNKQGKKDPRADIPQSPYAPMTPFKNSEAFLRLNYSQQSAAFLETMAFKTRVNEDYSLLANASSAKLLNLSRFHNIQLRKMAAKNVLRQGTIMKRLYCVRCSSPVSLAPIRTSCGRNTPKTSTVKYTSRCNRCGYLNSKITGGLSTLVIEPSSSPQEVPIEAHFLPTNDKTLTQ